MVSRSHLYLSLPFAATLLWLSVIEAQGHGRGIVADLAAAGTLGRPTVQPVWQVASPAEPRAPQDAIAQRAALRATIKAQTRELYRISRAGFVPASAGFDFARRHLASVAHLKRRLRSNLSALSMLEAQLASRPSPPATEAAPLAVVEPQRTAALPLLAKPPSSVVKVEQESKLDDDAFYGLRVHDQAPRGQFTAMKGQLATPVTGDFQVQSSQRQGSDPEELAILVSAGSTVRAAAAGRVAFADNYGSYGKLVILDHEGGFYTVYGGLSDVSVRVGDDLSQRARIGSVANRGDDSALYFEVRKGSRALPARSWLGL